MNHLDSIKEFDNLSSSGFVRLPVLVALYACSSATIWRGVKSGRIPRPRKLSPRTVGWNVGELRQALANTK